MKSPALPLLVVLLCASSAVAQDLPHFKFKKSAAPQSDGDTAERPAAQAPVPAGGVARCTGGDHLAALAGRFTRYASSPVALYLNTGDDPLTPAQTALCVLGRRAIWVAGYVPAQSVRVGREELVFDSMSLSPDSEGRVRLPLSAAATARVEGGSLKTASGDRAVDQVVEHHVPTSDLADRMGQVGGATEIESFEKVEDPAAGANAAELAVNVFSGDDLVAKVRKVVLREADGTICARNGALAPELDAYLRKEAAKPWLKKELGQFRADDVNSRPPALYLHCLGGSAAGAWNVAYTSWDGSGDSLAARDGKLVP